MTIALGGTANLPTGLLGPKRRWQFVINVTLKSDPKYSLVSNSDRARPIIRCFDDVPRNLASNS